MAGFRIERIDHAVVEIADQNVIGELAEARGRHREAPRRVEMPMLREVADEVAVGVEYGDEAMCRLVYRIVFRLVLQRVGDPDLSVDILDSERRVSMLHLGIGE